jgi:D-sedoheptulose 7-phosphate isomerase
MMTPPPVAILAGGLATRLGAVTETIPKALLDVGGKPFVAYQLELLRDAGIRRVVMCVAHLADRIEDAIGDGRAFGLDVRYSHDGGVLLGTGGALRRALPLLGDEFLVMYGDSYLRCDYVGIARAFHASGKRGLMTVYANDGRYDASNVVFQAGRIISYDKAAKSPEMTHIDWGLGAFRADAFAGYPTDQRLDLARVFQDLLAQDQLVGYEVHDRFYEIGSHAGLEETRQLLAKGTMTYSRQHLDEAKRIIDLIDDQAIERVAEILAGVRARGGRLFFLGVGGSAGNCGHAVNDFRKICGFEAYAPTDNVSELTARTNDDGWASVFVEWLRGSKLRKDDAVFVFSVGGGNLAKNISPNLVSALQLAKEVGASVVGVVGRDGGYTKQVADACVVVPTVNDATVTPHSEAFQGVVWHLLVSHPALKKAETKWESTAR